MNSALLGALAVIAQLGGLTRVTFLVVGVIIALAGYVIANDWRAILRNYRELLATRFDILKDLEARPDFQGSARLYHREDERLQARIKGLKNHHAAHFGFSQRELRLPGIFQVVYVLVVLTLAVALVAQIAHLSVTLPAF